jgi:hypothetical protein
MTSAEIISSIQNWEAIRNNSVAMNNYFMKGNCFMYDFPTYAESSASLHAYPGIYNDEMYFFVIPAEYDKEEYAGAIDKYTEPCMLQFILGNNRLTPQEANAREKAWDDNYPAWVTAQVGSTYGIFEAFVIPAEDCEVENVIMNLALKINASAIGGFEADLIVTNDEGKQIVYDDMSQPVPPFPAIPSQEDFYLLSAANI